MVPRKDTGIMDDTSQQDRVQDLISELILTDKLNQQQKLELLNQIMSTLHESPLLTATISRA